MAMYQSNTIQWEKLGRLQTQGACSTDFGTGEWADSVNSSRYHHGTCLDTQSGT